METAIRQEVINKAVDDYSFRVPYDGSNKFYDEEAAKHFLAGVSFAQEEMKYLIEHAFMDGYRTKIDKQ